MFECQEPSDVQLESSIESGPKSGPDQSAYWLDHIKSWELSGLNQSEYCRRHDLKYHVFLYWKRKLRKPSRPSSESDSLNFIEVGSGLSFGSIPTFCGNSDFIFRLWVKGICVELGNKFDPESLSRLLTCLRSV